MNGKPSCPNWIIYTLSIGLIVFTIGLILDDLYTVISGSSLVVMGIVSATGAEIMYKLDHPPKGL